MYNCEAVICHEVAADVSHGVTERSEGTHGHHIPKDRATTWRQEGNIYNVKLMSLSAAQLG